MISDVSRSKAKTDAVLIILVAAMSVFGIVAVTVASFTPGSNPDISFLNHVTESSYAMRQCLFVFIVAPLVVGVIMNIPYDFLRRRAELLYWAGVLLLVFVTVVNRATGVKAWLDVFDYTIQPSEFAKLSLILLLAKQFARESRPLSDLRSMLRFGLTVAIPCVVILAQGETGSMLVILFMVFIMMYFANCDKKLLISLIAVGALLILSLYGILKMTNSTDYRLARITGRHRHRHVRERLHEPAELCARRLDGLHLFHHRGGLGLRRLCGRTAHVPADPSPAPVSGVVYPRQVRPPDHLRRAGHAPFPLPSVPASSRCRRADWRCNIGR